MILFFTYVDDKVIDKIIGTIIEHFELNVQPLSYILGITTVIYETSSHVEKNISMNC